MEQGKKVMWHENKFNKQSAQMDMIWYLSEYTDLFCENAYNDDDYKYDTGKLTKNEQ